MADSTCILPGRPAARGRHAAYAVAAAAGYARSSLAELRGANVACAQKAARRRFIRALDRPLLGLLFRRSDGLSAVLGLLFPVAAVPRFSAIFQASPAEFRGDSGAAIPAGRSMLRLSAQMARQVDNAAWRGCRLSLRRPHTERTSGARHVSVFLSSPPAPLSV